MTTPIQIIEAGVFKQVLNSVSYEDCEFYSTKAPSPEMASHMQEFHLIPHH